MYMQSKASRLRWWLSLNGFAFALCYYRIELLPIYWGTMRLQNRSLLLTRHYAKRSEQKPKTKEISLSTKTEEKKRKDNWIPAKRRSRSRQVKELMELVLTQEEPLLLCRHYFVKQSWTPWQDREEVSITQSDSQEEEGPCADKSLEKYDVSRMPSQANK